MIRAVLFDMDGLLIDTEKWLVKNWQEAASQYGYALTRETALAIRSLAAKYAKPYLKARLGDSFPYEEVRALRRELVERDLETHGVQRKKGAVELLEWLQGRGIQTAVATATDEQRARRYLRQAGLIPYFDQVISAGMVENGKPAPDIYRYACHRLGQIPENCLALEDSPNGIKSAAEAGLHVIMVPDQTMPQEELLPLLRGVAEDLSQVIECIQKMEG